LRHRRVSEKKIKKNFLKGKLPFPFKFYSCFVKTEGGWASMSASERRLEIMRILEIRYEESLANLAFELGVSTRMIKYDIRALKDAHHPIETVRGRGGSVRLLDFARKQYKGDLPESVQKSLILSISTLSKEDAKPLCEYLRARGSFRNKDKIEEVLKNYYY
jgi:biotin operon repressor